ncbi:MAG: GNAT family N-acetyltransferase [Proteobacteria bacterium]|nr:GNAT family N-acetyltransferase [Pseudomonadota bacterium]
MTETMEAHRRSARDAMRIVSRRELGRDAWDAAADASPEAWLWHRYDLCDTAVRDWPGRTDASFAVVNANGQIEALVPAYVLERKSYFGVRVRDLNSNGGPALAPTVGRSRRQHVLGAVLAQFRARSESSRVIRTTITLPPMSPAFRGPNGPRCNPLLYMGCEDNSGQTWVVDLRDGSERAWKRFEGRARTGVRGAKEAGVTVRQSTDTSDWEAVFKLHQETYRRLGVPSYPAALFRTIFEQLVPTGLSVVYFAEWEGMPIAVANIACYKNGGYYWHGFASDQGLRTNAGTLLIWRAIEDLAANGTLAWFDCGEAVLHSGGKHRQLSEFKKSFGGELYPVFQGQLRSPIKLYNRLLHLKGLIKGD